MVAGSAIMYVFSGPMSNCAMFPYDPSSAVRNANGSRA